MNKKVVLAYSGGLDTSYCVKYLSKEKKLDVYSAIANTGGFDDKQLKTIEEKAITMGVKAHRTLDVTQEYYDKCIRYMIYGNVLKNNTYPLSVSSERAFQAMAIVAYAREIGAGYIAHGSTGAGNDQVRFDLIFNVMAPDIEVIAPIRELKLSREEEIAYLKKEGVDADWEKAAYSLNEGLWGTSIGGRETLNSRQPLPEEAYPNHCTEDSPREMSIEFDKGQICAVDGKKCQPVDAIRQIEAIASKYAIGRGMHVGDTIIGIKGRVGFEAAAPMIIIKAHHLLEKHTLTKWQQYWKEQLANWYGMLLHEAQYNEPVMRDIEAFLKSTQKSVNGKVFIRLMPYRFETLGIESPNDMMNAEFGHYGEENKAWSGQDVEGFTKILANQLKIYNSVNKK